LYAQGNPRGNKPKTDHVMPESIKRNQNLKTVLQFQMAGFS